MFVGSKNEQIIKIGSIFSPKWWVNQSIISLLLTLRHAYSCTRTESPVVNLFSYCQWFTLALWDENKEYNIDGIHASLGPRSSAALLSCDSCLPVCHWGWMLGCHNVSPNGSKQGPLQAAGAATCDVFTPTASVPEAATVFSGTTIACSVLALEGVRLDWGKWRERIQGFLWSWIRTWSWGHAWLADDRVAA